MLLKSYEPIEGFLDEEMRCGYRVSREIKSLWAVELDLYTAFCRVCEANGLRHFVSYGTLLGAVRHGGFIPWDDDIDILMPREDYNRLLKIGSDSFGEPYFFQTTLTEKYFWRAHIQLRNSNTTGYVPQDACKDINRGIFLDIAPLVEVSDSKIGRWFHRAALK